MKMYMRVLGVLFVITIVVNVWTISTQSEPVLMLATGAALLAGVVVGLAAAVIYAFGNVQE